ncbi:LPXTG-motif cell wall anchor domain-containing protein [Cryptosporangium aurantiacum]|uniref:LPXTG-motif cell wall anchor domain-containing protein n=2 Tax=Cryptosporangium aurantiacum TaxID=134849 RepID=A0A1M7RN74_9ACTN|nr:LPXTG-motif cell wall anchor domain-containing protein [Cryptosporangium aurantiacum]
MVTGLVTMGAVALTAAPANAHENYVKGTAECVDGRYVVEWTVQNLDEEHDEKLTVSFEPTGSETEIADEIKAGESIKGTQKLPKGSRGIKDKDGRDVAKIYVKGVFLDKDGKPAFKEDGKTPLVHEEWVDVPLPGTCGDVKPSETPAPDKPSASIVLSCEAFSIELVNPTDKTVKFRVFIKLDDDKPLTEEFRVDAGEKLTLPADLDKEDAGSVGKVSEEGELEFSKIKVAVAVRDQKLAEKSLDLATCEDGAEPTASPSVSASVAPGGDASPSVSPAADSEDSLPVTGASLGGLIAAAALVLGLGVAMVVVTRRRKRA